jgi:hypothetical protein
MNVVFETNKRGYLGWIPQYPGAYLRGKTIDDACAKIVCEMREYGEWIDSIIEDNDIEEISIIESKLAIEDADSDIILETEKQDYRDIKQFAHECELAILSAEKAMNIFDACHNKSTIDTTMVRKTFYGDVYTTIEGQFNHIVNVQDYYLYQIKSEADVKTSLVLGRQNTIRAIKGKYEKEGNRLYMNGSEEWSIRKVLRRLIWHDRIHMKAIIRMKSRLEGT